MRSVIREDKKLIIAIAFTKSLILFILFIALLFWVGTPDRKYNFIKLQKEEILRDMEQAYLEERYEEAKTIAEFVKSSEGFTEEERQKADEIYKRSEDTLNSLVYKAKKCGKSIVYGIPEDITSLFCVFISDMTIFGDVRDVFREGFNFLRGKEVDEFVLGLSALGLVSPAFDFLRALRKTSALSEPLAKAVVKDRKLAQSIWDTGNIWRKQAGIAPYARTLKFVENEKQLENLYKYTQKHGAVATYLAVQKTNGKILESYKPLVLYTSAPQLIRVGIKDFFGKDGLSITYKALDEMLKEKFGFWHHLILPFAISLIYLLLNLILPFRDIKSAFVFAGLLFGFTFVYGFM